MQHTPTLEKTQNIIAQKPLFTIGSVAFTKSLVAIILLSLSLVIVTIASGIGLFYLNDQNQKLTTALEITENSEEFQRNQKDQIRDLWENQTALNDDLVFLQVQLFNRLELYQKQLTDVFSFEEGQFKQTGDVNRSNFKRAEDDLYNVLTDIDEKIDENADAKAQAKAEVDRLYIEAQEDQRNRIDFVDGIGD